MSIYPIPGEEYYGVNIFLKYMRFELNVIARLEFQQPCFEDAILHFNHYSLLESNNLILLRKNGNKSGIIMTEKTHINLHLKNSKVKRFINGNFEANIQIMSSNLNSFTKSALLRYLLVVMFFILAINGKTVQRIFEKKKKRGFRDQKINHM